jgi:hypothetical protein
MKYGQREERAEITFQWFPDSNTLPLGGGPGTITGVLTFIVSIAESGDYTVVPIRTRLEVAAFADGTIILDGATFPGGLLSTAKSDPELARLVTRVLIGSEQDLLRAFRVDLVGEAVRIYHRRNRDQFGVGIGWPPEARPRILPEISSWLVQLTIDGPTGRIEPGGIMPPSKVAPLTQLLEAIVQNAVPEITVVPDLTRVEVEP